MIIYVYMLSMNHQHIATCPCKSHQQIL